MNKKHIYETPVSDLLVVRFEGNFCGTVTPQGTEQGNNRDNEGDDFYFA